MNPQKFIKKPFKTTIEKKREMLLKHCQKWKAKINKKYKTKIFKKYKKKKKFKNKGKKSRKNPRKKIKKTKKKDNNIFFKLQKMKIWNIKPEF